MVISKDKISKTMINLILINVCPASMLNIVFIVRKEHPAILTNEFNWIKYVIYFFLFKEEMQVYSSVAQFKNPLIFGDFLKHSLFHIFFNTK